MEKVLIIIAVVLIIFIGVSINSGTEEETLIENKTVEVSQNENIVVINNGKIENENLIDEFMKNTTINGKNELELNIEDGETNIKIEFTPGENALRSDGTIEVGDASAENNKRLFGYFSIYKDNQLSNELDLLTWHLNRVTKDRKVTLRFETLAEVEEFPIVCEYDLESSNYNERLLLTYSQRKDLGINELFDAGSYKINSFGGNINIKINETEYTLKEALENKIITSEEILEQLKDDAKYGLCDIGYYSDGGSTEYRYSEYTVLKLDTLDGDKDLVIGMHGSIINEYQRQK